MYRRDLLFREDPHTETEVEELEDANPIEGNTQNAEEGWDIVVKDLQDNEDFEDYDDGNVFVQDIS